MSVGTLHTRTCKAFGHVDCIRSGRATYERVSGRRHADERLEGLLGTEQLQRVSLRVAALLVTDLIQIVGAALAQPEQLLDAQVVVGRAAHLVLAVRVPLLLVPAQAVLVAPAVLVAATVHLLDARVARVAAVQVALLARARAVALLI